MWHFKDKDCVKQYNKVQMANIIGLHPQTLRRIIKGVQPCSKLVAYSITKFLDKDAEIIDYFKGE